MILPAVPDGDDGKFDSSLPCDRHVPHLIKDRPGMQTGFRYYFARIGWLPEIEFRIMI
jgi:hypothetical protein